MKNTILALLIALLSGCAAGNGTPFNTGAVAERTLLSKHACKDVTLSRKSGPQYATECEVR